MITLLLALIDAKTKIGFEFVYLFTFIIDMTMLILIGRAIS
jgi:hypothetical protein